MKKISILILTYFSEQEIKTCLDSILNSSCDKDFLFEVIVLDNNSQDATASIVIDLCKSYKELTFIQNKENIGFARGINQLALNASGDYFVILNPDTIATRQSVCDMVSYLESHDNVGAIGPRIVDNNGITQETFGQGISLWSELFGKIVLSRYLEKVSFIAQLKKKIFYKKYPTSVGWVGGACIAIPAPVFRLVQGIDEHFFFSYVDMIDMCARIKKYNFDIVFLPSVTIVHLGSKSVPSNRPQALIETYKGGLYYFKKHNGLFVSYSARILYGIISIIKSLTSFVLFLITKNTLYREIGRAHYKSLRWLMGFYI